MTLCSFKDILGQEKAREMLLRSHGLGRLSHAYLFRGPAGVGKKTMALALAAFVNCQQPVDQDGCGVCPSCKKLATANHPDFHVMETDKGAIKIDHVRKLKKMLSFPPLEARYRTVVIPDIHRTLRRREVGNSLLKTLEEPPQGTLLILTADQAGEVLNTIRSRCQVIPFYPLSVQQAAQCLTRASQFEEQAALTLAGVAEGSPGKAGLLAAKDLLGVRQTLVEEVATVERQQPDAPERILRLAEQTAGLKENIYDFLDLLQLWVRDLLVLASGGSQSLLVNQDLLHTFEAAGQRWTLSELFEKLTLIDRARKQLIQNCNRVSVCEVLLWEFL